MSNIKPNPEPPKPYTIEVELPAFLASALINGDTSGLEDSDMPHYESALKLAEGGSYVDVGEETYFSRTCDLPGFRLGADMAVYTILYSK